MRMDSPSRPRLRKAGWLAFGVCVFVALLTIFGYRAIREWELSSSLLVQQRAGTAAELLSSALTRDMQAVQRSVLAAIDWDSVQESASYQTRDVVADAFAKYPYPESFFAARGALRDADLIFYSRSDRLPPWNTLDPARRPFPVSESREPGIASEIIAHARRDSWTGRRFDVFEATIAGTLYQVVVRLRYRDPSQREIDGLVGFMVNLAWVRQHYFQVLTRQVSDIGGSTTAGLSLAVLDEHGREVAATPHARVETVSGRRPFPLMFFDPLLVAVGQSADFPRREWTVEVTRGPDATLVPAIQAANRTLVLAACAAVSLAVGFVMTARAMNASAELTELRSEFVSTVTHELKTPIASIRAVGDTLASGRITSTTGQREYAQLAVREAKRLARLVDNLLALSRITDVAEVYFFEALSVHRLIERALEGFQEQLRARHFETRLDIPANLAPLAGDQTAIGLLLDNLIDNAIRYSPTSRLLVISARQTQTLITIDIIDQGQGIPEDEIGQVTRKFFRGRHFVANGSGLGLAIVKRIVTEHHGQLSIASTVGVGTTVSVSFPVAEVDEEADSDR